MTDKPIFVCGECGKRHKHFDAWINCCGRWIMDFDIREFKMMLMNIRSDFVSIGADSKGHNLPEPSREKLLELIEWLKTITEVKIKKNLNRILNKTTM